MSDKEKLKLFIEQNKDKIYEIAKRNTKYNSQCQPVIDVDDEWFNEDIWDEMFSEIKSEEDDINKVIEGIRQ